MKKPPLPLRSARLCNFKAVRDSRVVKFTPLTAFIGNNGSGKSSLIEGLEALQAMVLRGLDEAMHPFRGFEHAWNKAVTHDEKEGEIGVRERANPMEFDVEGRAADKPFAARLSVSADLSANTVFFARYDAPPTPGKSTDPQHNNYFDPASVFTKFEVTDVRLKEMVSGWQFLSIEPTAMLYPRPQRRSSEHVRLDRNGANIAEYLFSIRDQDADILDGIVESLTRVLSYATGLRPAITSELERSVYMLLEETDIAQPHPSWLLSQGTLRVIALLAVFRHPQPPSVVFIEEIENGLDPRTIHLVVDEIQTFLEAGGQVVITTHSPFLLDLLTLPQIVVVERNERGSPEFTRPANNRALADWRERFTPGALYTMGRLTHDNA